MNELWYVIDTPYNRIETTDYLTAQTAREMGNKVRVEYRYKNLDHVAVDPEHHRKLMDYYGYTD